VRIVLFGTGCDLCREIAGNVETAIRLSGREIEFEKTSDLQRMLSYGIKSTPSLVIDDTVVSVSVPLSVEEISAFIRTADPVNPVP